MLRTCVLAIVRVRVGVDTRSIKTLFDIAMLKISVLMEFSGCLDLRISSRLAFGAHTEAIRTKGAFSSFGRDVLHEADESEQVVMSLSSLTNVSL